MQRREVVITGFGIVSPLACSLDELVESFERGDRVVPSPQTGSRSGQPAALVAELPLDVVPEATRSRIGRLDRLCRLYLSASCLALDSAALAPPSAAGDGAAERSAISFGTGLGCLLTNAEYNARIVEGGVRAASPRLFAYTVSNAAAGEVSIALGITGPNLTAHHGLAAGIGSLGYGADLIELDKADVVLAGGADACGDDLVDALAALGVTGDAADMLPSEAAVVVVLESADHARARGARVLARLEAYASGFDPALTGSECDGDAIRSVALRALARCGRSPGEVAEVWPTASSARLERLEREAIERALDPSSRATYFATKPVLGETFAAAGMLALALCVGRRLRDTRGGAGAGAVARHGGGEVALIHALCYSGNTLAAVVRPLAP